MTEDIFFSYIIWGPLLKVINYDSNIHILIDCKEMKMLSDETVLFLK